LEFEKAMFLWSEYKCQSSPSKSTGKCTVFKKTTTYFLGVGGEVKKKTILMSVNVCCSFLWKLQVF
jgi:hypothetical protein